MNIPLTRVLADFGRPAPAPAPQEEPGRSTPAPPPGFLAEDHAASLVEEAFARGEQAGRAAAAAELVEKLAEAHSAAEERLAAEHQRWRSEHADELAVRLSSGIEELESRVASSVARVLTPFVTAELRTNMIEALGESIRTLFSGGAKAALRIRGPEDLLAELRGKLGAVPAAIEWEESRDADVRVIADQTMIETEIQKWIDRFAETGR